MNCHNSRYIQKVIIFTVISLCSELFSGVLLQTISVVKYDTKYLRVPVDHLNFANSSNFKLRYLQDNTYWDSTSGPIFLVVGGDMSITEQAKLVGFVWDIAPEFNASIVLAENRYYGDSLPYGSKSYDTRQQLVYLNIDQVLADLTDLITRLRRDQPKDRKSPVIAIGAGYSGFVATWLRTKFPFLVQGSLVSSSAFLQLYDKIPCNTFYQGVTMPYASVSQNCPKNVRNTWDELDNMVKTDEGKQWISSNWNLCKELKNSSDVDKLFRWFSLELSYVAMANFPFNTEDLPANPVAAFCKHLDGAGLQGKELLSAVSDGIQLWYNHTGDAKCLDTSKDVSNVNYDAWVFQTCTELYFALCADGINDMFPVYTWNKTEEYQSCLDWYKVKPRWDSMEQEYGGVDFRSYTNIIFSQGLLDPWSGGGFLKNISSGTTTIVIPEAAHNLDLYGSNPADPKTVIMARNIYRMHFRKWIAEFGLLDPWSGGGFLKNISSGTTTIVIPDAAHHLDLYGSNPADPESVIEARNIYRMHFRKWIAKFSG